MADAVNVMILPPLRAFHAGMCPLPGWPRQIVGACLCVILSLGCATGGWNRGGNEMTLHLLHSPGAINLDDQPGPDGFALKVFATSARSSKGATLPPGELEILMFDGALRDGAPFPAPPRKVWKFGAKELRGHESQSTLGTAYEFLLRWETNSPVTSRITVLARHRGRADVAVQSASSIITVSQP